MVRRRGHDPAKLTSDRIRTRPAVILAALLTDIHEIADHPRRADMTTPGTDTVHVDDLHPCGRDNCVHGWLTKPTMGGPRWLQTLQSADWSVKPCPDCDPRLRRGLTTNETHDQAHDLYGDSDDQVGNAAHGPRAQ